MGRRYQLAYELIQQIPWLSRASVPRIAWVARHVADAGWTTVEVRAWLHLRGGASHVRRPSGFLAQLLRNAPQVLDTPAKRAAAVTQWRDSHRAAHARHEEWEGTWSGPRNPTVVRQVHTAVQQVRGAEQVSSEASAAATGPLDLEQLSREEIIDLRAAAQKDVAFIEITIATCGEAFARRLFTGGLVDQTRRLKHTSRLVLHGCGIPDPVSFSQRRCPPRGQ
ncbi:hypothetical protein ABZW18_00210 [Streptomyces sp. NPDC004647]|uniref:hypothetical protein n=1 Tax=Streptomyces sp. NPDC004647 TaxID=3154671 RepID=UPI0033A09F17